jgi:hypothetical protein
VINRIDAYFKSIHCVSGKNLGVLIAIGKLRFLFLKQHLRQNVVAKIKPSPKQLINRNRLSPNVPCGLTDWMCDAQRGASAWRSNNNDS